MIQFIKQLLCSHGYGRYRNDWLALRAVPRDGEAPMFCMKCGKNFKNFQEVWKE
jgi:hypothetical protein